MSKSNKYGYSGVDIPDQAFGSNSGKFDPAEINELVADNKWTQYGQLELIETQTYSTVNAVNFENMEVDTYNVHFLTYQFHTGAGDVGIFGRFGIKNTNGTYSYRDANNHYANLRGEANNTFGEYKSTAMWAHQHANLGTMNTSPDGLGFTGYLYLYNLGDSTKHSQMTQHSIYTARTTNTACFNIGSASYPTLERHEAYSIFPNTQTTSGVASLYGLRYS